MLGRSKRAITCQTRNTTFGVFGGNFLYTSLFILFGNFFITGENKCTAGDKKKISLLSGMIYPVKYSFAIVFDFVASLILYNIIILSPIFLHFQVTTYYRSFLQNLLKFFVFPNE